MFKRPSQHSRGFKDIKYQSTSQLFPGQPHQTRPNNKEKEDFNLAQCAPNSGTFFLLPLLVLEGKMGNGIYIFEENFTYGKGEAKNGQGHLFWFTRPECRGHKGQSQTVYAEFTRIMS